MIDVDIQNLKYYKGLFSLSPEQHRCSGCLESFKPTKGGDLLVNPEVEGEVFTGQDLLGLVAIRKLILNIKNNNYYLLSS